MSVAPPGGQDRIMIYGPKSDGTYIIEFRMADSESLAISVPAGETRVLKHFQARITCPDMGFSPTRAAGFPHAQPSRPVFFCTHKQCYTNPQIELPAAAQSRRAMDMIFHG